jgi:molybdenum cofactor synthesis domain-containing protein
MKTAGILTISDRGSRGEYEDKSGAVIAELLQNNTEWQIRERAIVPDEVTHIAGILQQWSNAGISLILTTGGTGFAPRDVTPEATRQVIQREAPGIAEMLRAESYKVTRHAMLSRGIAGICQRTLIINLPGSPKAVKECVGWLLPILPHALDLLAENAGTEAQHRTV